MPIDVRLIGESPAYPSAAPHRLDYYQLILVEEGKANGSLDGRPFELGAGDLLCSGPGQILSVLYEPPVFRWVVCFTPQALGRTPVGGGWEWGASVRDRDRRRVADNLRAIRAELTDLRAGSGWVLQSMLTEILARLDRSSLALEDGARQARGGIGEPFASRFAKCLEKGFRRTHRVEDYARQLNLSSSRLAALCRRELGRPPKRLIMERLATEAKRQLLFTDAAATQIGENLGFVDESYFYRFFRRTTGQTPSDFRSQYRSVPAER